MRNIIYALCIASSWILFIKGINIILKYIFVYLQYSPQRPCLDACYWCSGSGMPSGHVQLATWLCTVLFRRVYRPYVLWAMWLFVCIQRILSSCHTIEQVCVGAIIGGILGQMFKHLI